MSRTLLLLLLACLPGRAAYFDQWDREAYAWRQAVGTNSSSVSGTSYNSATRLMQGMKQFGIRESVVDCCAYLGADLNACLIRIVHDIDPPAVLDNQGFLSGDYTEATGLTGNGTSKFLSTRTVAFSTIGSFGHLAVYCRTAGAASQIVIGGQNGGTSSYMYVGNSDDKDYFLMNHAPPELATGTDTNAIGFYLGTRPTTNFIAIYKNGVQLASDTTGVVLTAPSVTIFIHALNNAASPLAWSAKCLSFYSIGRGLNPVPGYNYEKIVARVQYDARRKVP